MKTIFLVAGYPCSGKTTVANELAAYLREHDGREVYQFSRDIQGSWESNMDTLSLKLFKWFKVGDASEFMTIDAPGYTVFDRKEILDMIDDEIEQNGMKPEDVRIVAISLSRSIKFSIEHNQDKGHRPYQTKKLGDLFNLYQQPVLAEGFDMIYRIDRNYNIVPEHLFSMMRNAMHFDVPDALVGSASYTDGTFSTGSKEAMPTESAPATEAEIPTGDSV